jgi:TolB-like protein/DNA-binding winged helix-turn-helix (wHTH) protein/Flp pilus assembly protein TadD
MAWVNRPELYQFGPFQLDEPEHRLLRDGQPVQLPPKAYDLLLVLVTRSGHLVTKDELLRQVWPDTFVEEANLSYTVSVLRKALADEREPHRYIETVPKIGYRFSQPVVPSARQSAETPDGRNLQRPSGRNAAVLAIAVLVAIAGVAVWWQRRLVPRAEIRSIAVLPLKNLSTDPAKDFFVEGVHEALITELAHLGIPVVARSSAMQYVGTKKSLATIGRELNVEAVVEGAIERSGNDVRISVQLVDAATAQTLWGAAFSRDLRDVLALHDEVAQAIAGQIVTAARGARAHRASGGPIDPETYELYLKGRYHLNRRTEEDFAKAVAHFENVIARDARFAPAYAGLADCLTQTSIYGSLPPRETMPKAKRSAIEAIALDDTSAEGHASLAWVLLNYEWNWEAADREFRSAIDRNPSYELARTWYGLSLVWRGRFEQGRAELLKGQQLDPVSRSRLAPLGIAFFLAGNYERSIHETNAALEIGGNHAGPYTWLGLAQVHSGLHQEAVRSIERSLALDSEVSINVGRAGYVYARAGQIDKARDVLRRLAELSQRRYVSAVDLAFVHVGLGNTDGALAMLERGLEERAHQMVYLKIDPRFDPLRSDPRFQRLLRAVNFPN